MELVKIEVFMMKSIPKKDLWTGRIDKDPFSLRYHQVVQLHQVDQLPKIGHNKVFSLIGFECDEGVRRNQGRVGAAQAPNEIRKFLSSLPFHQREEKVIRSEERRVGKECRYRGREEEENKIKI